MKFFYAKPLPATPENLLRSAGYYPHTDRKTGQSSFIRRLSPDFYPRFHMYIDETDKAVSFHLHLDQKKASYQGTSMHAGEYEGPTVEREVKRIKQAFLSAISNVR